MSWKPTLWLLVLAVLTGLFLVVFEQHSDQAVRPMPLNTPLLPLSPAVITRISLSTDSNAVECVRRDGEWFLIRPVEARADAARINRLIEAVVGTRKQEIVDSVRRDKRGLTLASFGLEPPRARLMVGSDTHANEIRVGDDAPLGNLVYLQLDDERAVVGATLKVSEILPLDPEGFRDRSVFPASIKQAIRLEVKHAGGFFQLALKDGVWRIQQPFDARADGLQVERLWRTLESLKVEGLAEKLFQADPAAYGLGVDEAALQVSVWIERRREPLVVTVGKARQDNPSQLYARISDAASLAVVGRDILSLQSIQAGSLRDRRLCGADLSAISFLMLRDDESKVVMEKSASGGWMITEPLRFPASARAVGALLKAVDLLQGDEVRSGAGAGVELPDAGALSCRLVVANQVPPRAATNETVSVLPASGSWTYRLSAPGAGSSSNWVYGEESKVLYSVSRDDLARLWRSLAGMERPVFADPLAYMDVRMLDLEPLQVRRITLARDGREETVTVVPDGGWTADSPPDGQVVVGAIPALLARASDLQAQRIESVASTNLASYKLDSSAARVTFGLSGAGGIQKTVLIGGGDGRGGVFSMVQGQDVIFVLAKDVADAMVRPLVVAP
jgi:hypothetical protein